MIEDAMVTLAVLIVVLPTLSIWAVKEYRQARRVEGQPQARGTILPEGRIADCEEKAEENGTGATRDGSARNAEEPEVRQPQLSLRCQPRVPHAMPTRQDPGSCALQDS